MDVKENLGYYEKRLCLLLFLSSIPNGFTTLQVLVTQFTPTHRCDVLKGMSAQLPSLEYINQSKTDPLDEILNLTIPWEKTSAKTWSRSKCFQFESFNISQENQTTVPCVSMHYEGIEVSAVTEFNLVCDRAWMRPVLTMIQFAGMTVGCLISGYLGDRFGRRPVFLVFTAWQFIALLMLSFAPEVWSYAFLFLLCGTANLINYNIASVIGSEMTTKKYRLRMYFLLLMGYAVGYMMMSPLAYWLRNWRWFLRFCGLTGLLYIPYFWLIDETPRWLLATGRVSEAEKILVKIARINCHCESSVDSLSQESQKTFTAIQTIVKIAKEPILLLRLAISIFLWFTLGLMYYALAFNTNNLSGNRFLNIFLSSLTEVGGGLLFLVCEQKLGRVNTYILPTTLFGLSMILTCFVPQNQITILISLNMFVKLTVSTSYGIVYSHVMEMFPTKVRQTVLSIVILGSRVGAILAPILIYVGEEGDILTPSLIVASLALLAAFCSAFLPETKGIPLAQSVEEAKALTRRRWCVTRLFTRKATLERQGKLHTLDAAIENRN